MPRRCSSRPPPCCCSAARSARVHSSLCTCGSPTPWPVPRRSPLIHSATMVAAGVYLVARMFEVFIQADPFVLTFVAVIGAITLLLAAFLALVQDDIKRVLAYSTVSQLAYMVAALGVGSDGYPAAMFH